MGGLTFEKLLLIGVIAMFIFGPERLPQLASQLATWIKQVRAWADGAKDRAKAEFGDDFDVDEWRKLDPRQYDPRRIIRDAWNEAGAAPTRSTGSTALAAGTDVTTAERTSAPSWASRATADADQLVPGRAPFDIEAT